MEDIKARYYSVARQLLTGRDGGAEGVGNQAIIKHPYNPEHERCAACCMAGEHAAVLVAFAFRAMMQCLLHRDFLLASMHESSTSPFLHESGMSDSHRQNKYTACMRP